MSEGSNFVTELVAHESEGEKTVLNRQNWPLGAPIEASHPAARTHDLACSPKLPDELVERFARSANYLSVLCSGTTRSACYTFASSPSLDTAIGLVASICPRGLP